jgi:hypothetical protein
VQIKFDDNCSRSHMNGRVCIGCLREWPPSLLCFRYKRMDVVQQGGVIPTSNKCYQKGKHRSSSTGNDASKLHAADSPKLISDFFNHQKSQTTVIRTQNIGIDGWWYRVSYLLPTTSAKIHNCQLSLSGHHSVPMICGLVPSSSWVPIVLYIGNMLIVQKVGLG